MSVEVPRASEEANRARWQAADDAWRGYARLPDGGLWLSRRVTAALELIDRRAPGSRATMLDIGCATGVITRQCATKLDATRIEAIDFVTVQDPLLSAGEPPIVFSAVNLDGIEPLPFEDGQFDLVTCFETLEHLHDTDRMVREIRRVLAPNGKAIVSVPRIDGIVSILMLAAGLQPPAIECSVRARYGSPDPGARVSGHVSHFTLRALHELLRANGLRVGRTLQGGIYEDWVRAAPRALLQRLPLWCLSKVPFKRDVMIVEAFNTGR